MCRKEREKRAPTLGKKQKKNILGVLLHLLFPLSFNSPVTHKKKKDMFNNKEKEIENKNGNRTGKLIKLEQVY